MLTKNIYILFPAGYGGSYVNWAIDVSDKDKFETINLTPINYTDSMKLGGVGTAHHHTRTATHQGFREFAAWMIRNKPSTPAIYLINEHIESEKFISEIMYQDPTGIFISIHADDDPLVESYGMINGVTKWPTCLEITLETHCNTLGSCVLPALDRFNCKDSLDFRNAMVLNHGVLGISHRLSRSRIEQKLEYRRLWATGRNARQPHEIRADEYLLAAQSINSRVFDFSCLDIVSETFPTRIQTILEESKAVDNIDCSYLTSYHQTYIDAQPNLQWFESVTRWKDDGIIDNYLNSHSIIQAQMILMIFLFSGIQMTPESVRGIWAWHRHTLGEYIDEIKSLSLPDFITCDPVNQVIMNIVRTGQWKTLTLTEINAIYQQSKSS